MTEQQLCGLRLISKEIEIIKNQMEDLKPRNLIKGNQITGTPYGSKFSDHMADTVPSIREIEELYEIKIKELYTARAKIERYINTIEDSETRMIIRLRCINNLPWEDIAAEMTLLDDKGKLVKEVSRQTVWRRYKKFFAI